MLDLMILLLNVHKTCIYSETMILISKVHKNCIASFKVLAGLGNLKSSKIHQSMATYSHIASISYLLFGMVFENPSFVRKGGP